MNIAWFRKPLVAVLAMALLPTGCSTTRPVAQPSITLGSGATATPGMPGMSGMPSTSGALAGTASATPSAPVAGDQVGIDDFAFAPASVTVRAGSTVTWTNHDEEPHTVAATDGSFHSPGMGTGATYSHTFATAGQFDYVCSIHPSMRGTVVVTP